VDRALYREAEIVHLVPEVLEVCLDPISRQGRSP
jgi:hypothetical protein